MAIRPTRGLTCGRAQNDDWRSPGVSDQVISTLALYLGAAGVTEAIKSQVFLCMSAWLRAGELPASAIAASPLLDFLFSSLDSDDLFEPAVDAICDLVHETQEIDDNMKVIEQIVPRLIALKPKLQEHGDDPDRLRGYCRMFVEAGEWYALLIADHPEAFLPLVEAIALCCSHDDLEVVGITFNFWYRLATRLSKKRGDGAIRPLLDVYSGLVETIIRHLHYPENLEALAGQEGEDFRRFRHDIGDTLKDCCHILGADRCLRRAYELIVQAMEAANKGGQVRWQDIEAPLFSMRTMGAEVDPREDTVLPLIMDVIPKLPHHPKIRYATILVLCRYTEWTDLHPEGIPFQLQYISSGFDDQADEVKLAAAQAMKFLCRDCSTVRAIDIDLQVSTLTPASAASRLVPPSAAYFRPDRGAYARPGGHQ